MQKKPKKPAALERSHEEHHHHIVSMTLARSPIQQCSPRGASSVRRPSSYRSQICMVPGCREESSGSSQSQFLHLPQKAGPLFARWFIHDVDFQTRGGRSPTTSASRRRGSAERHVQGRGLVGGGAARGAPAGGLVVRGASVSLFWTLSVLPFALCAARTANGADIVAVVAAVAQRHVLREA